LPCPDQLQDPVLKKKMPYLDLLVISV